MEKLKSLIDAEIETTREKMKNLIAITGHEVSGICFSYLLGYMEALEKIKENLK